MVGQSQGFERQPGAQTRQTDKFHFLYKTTLSRLGEVSVLSDVQKQTQRVEENKETEDCVPNKITRYIYRADFF